MDNLLWAKIKVRGKKRDRGRRGGERREEEGGGWKEKSRKEEGLNECQ